MNKLILKKDTKSFVYLGYFYGYIAQDKMYVYTAKESFCFSMTDINPRNGVGKLKIRIFTLEKLKTTAAGNNVNFGIQTYSHFLPDIVFESEYLVLKFYKFIKECQDIS